MNVTVVSTKEELKEAISNSVEEIELSGKLLEQYKAYKLLKKYGLLTAVATAGVLALSRFIPGINLLSVVKMAVKNGDKIDPKLILKAIALIAPLIAVLLPVIIALLKDYEEVEVDYKNGRSRFRKKAK